MSYPGRKHHEAALLRAAHMLMIETDPELRALLLDIIQNLEAGIRIEEKRWLGLPIDDEDEKPPRSLN